MDKVRAFERNAFGAAIGLAAGIQVIEQEGPPGRGRDTPLFLAGEQVVQARLGREKLVRLCPLRLMRDVGALIGAVVAVMR